VSERKAVGVFHGEARVGEIYSGFAQLTLTPSDLASPLSLQMALSRMYDALMKAAQEGPKKKYVAEVRFTDSMGNPVVIALELGEKAPLFTKRQLKARVMIEIYEEDLEEREHAIE